jgi:uncharacterized membrane protein YbhN (UPF0104 family)
MNETKSFIPKKLDQVNWQLVLKFGLSFGLLGWVFSKIPFNTLVDNLRHCSLPCILLAFFMANLCMLVSACKWQPLLKVQDIKIPFWRLLAYYYAGLFANNFLPSSIGGDALRIYDVGRESGKIKEAAASVVLERLLASLALGLTAALAMLFMSQQTNSRLVYGAVAALVTICLVLTGFILIYPFKGEGKLGRWLYQMGHYRKYPGILLLVLLMSFVFQGCLVLCNVFTFQAVGIDLPIYVHFLYVPVIMAVSMIPLSKIGRASCRERV